MGQRWGEFKYLKRCEYLNRYKCKSVSICNDVLVLAACMEFWSTFSNTYSRADPFSPGNRRWQGVLWVSWVYEECERCPRMSAECDNCSQPRPRFPVGNVSAGGRRSSEGEARDQPEGRRAAGEHRPDSVQSTCIHLHRHPVQPNRHSHQALPGVGKTGWPAWSPTQAAWNPKLEADLDEVVYLCWWPLTDTIPFPLLMFWIISWWLNLVQDPITPPKPPVL